MLLRARVSGRGSQATVPFTFLLVVRLSVLCAEPADCESVLATYEYSSWQQFVNCQCEMSTKLSSANLDVAFAFGAANL